MLVIVWYFVKHEMSGAPPNITNISDTFKVSRSQLSCLITTKKFKSSPSTYVAKKRKLPSKDELSTSKARNEETEDKDDWVVEELMNYLLE